MAEYNNLIATGSKVACPVCGKRAMSQLYRPFHQSGIGQHIRALHPELEKEVLAASKNRIAAKKKAEQEAQEEARLRPLRKHVVTGAFLDEIADEITSLMNMMEPYYSQGSGADSAEELLKRIEQMLKEPTQ